jgi:hypothetical protein
MFTKNAEYGYVLENSGSDGYDRRLANISYISMLDEDFSHPLTELHDDQLLLVAKLAVKNKTVGMLTARSRTERIDKDKISKMISEATKESKSCSISERESYRT